jgi:hypothetical protein
VRRLTHRAGLLALALALACGADDRLAPYSAPPPACPRADDYLVELYALEAEGRIARLSAVIRERIPGSARRDLLDALLGLGAVFEDGDFSSLADRPPPDPSRPGLQATLGRIVRWLAESGPTAPNLPLLGVLRSALATCEGGPVFSLLADAVADPDLVTALLETLASEGLVEGLRGLDFAGPGEPGAEDGREAMAYLVRNLLVSATSDSFDVASIVDLLGLLVDLDAPPYRGLADGLVRLLDADGLSRLQGLLVCLQRIDRELALGRFLYDFLTSGLLADIIPEGPTKPLPESTRELAQKALEGLATHAEIRRGLVPALLAILADDVAPPVLSDVASLLEAGALSGVLDLVIDLASGACRLTPSPDGSEPVP